MSGPAAADRTRAPSPGRASGSLPVTLLLRRPVPGWHSIETVFATVAAHLPADVAVAVHVSPRRSVGVGGRLANLRDAWRLRRTPGVLHVTGDVHYLVLALPRRRTVLTVHDLGTLATGGRLRRALIGLLWFRLPVRRAARVTVVSEATRADLVRLLPACADRVTVIPNPVPTDLAVDVATRAPGERPVVLAVGATPNKNLARLAAAVAPLPVDLVVVGDVPADVGAVLAGGAATLTTHLDLPRHELVARYRGADVVALVSTSEGFGLPVVEAQAAGVPVVASRIPALVEVAGGAAQLVDPLDVAAIRAGIAAVLGDPALRADLVARGRINAARYAPAAIASRYADVYRAVAASGAADRAGPAPESEPESEAGPAVSGRD